MQTKHRLFLLFLFFNYVLFAQENHKSIKKELSAKRVSSHILVDGLLNEKEWESAETATDFIMFQPDNGKPLAENKKTTVKILYDNEGIYIGAQMLDDEPQKILKEITERDDFGTSDFFGIFINGYNDGQQDFRFFVTAAGGQADCLATDQMGEDYSWNAIWTSNVKITNTGWTVEIKIPYAALRFPNSNTQVWGLNFMREIKRYRQKFTWQHVNSQLGSFTVQAGILKGIENINTPTRLFLIPYMSSYLTVGDYSPEKQIKGGLDIKYGLNDAFTLDAILVPDFGQTKYDNVVLNLGPFEQTFNENRPFFTEGTELFSKGNLLYSRRIGGVPYLYTDVKDNEYIEKYPTNINLLNAVKFSGRTKDGLGIGILNAVTEKTTATAIDANTGNKREAIISPLTNYNVTVLDQRFNQNSSVTLVNTNVMRNGSFRDANVFALLFDIYDKKNVYNLSGDLKLSSKYDDEKNTGANASIYFGETEGKWRYGGGATYISKNFDNNDLGVNFQTDFTSAYSNLSYRILNPNKTFNTFSIYYNNYFEINNQTSQLQSSNINFNINSNNKKNHYIGAGLSINPFYNYDYYEPRQNGRYYIHPKTTNTYIYISTNYNNKFAIDISPETNISNEKGRYSYSIYAAPRYRFSDRLLLTYSFSYYHALKTEGWADTLDDNIIFAQRTRKNIVNTVSTKYSISPNMNFNLSVRHYWSIADNKAYFNLQDNGDLLENLTYTANKDTNFNVWNLDLSYSWWFAPGSQITALYRNNAFTADNEISKSFSNNISSLLTQNNLTHIFSISLRYFIDYNQAKNWLKK